MCYPIKFVTYKTTLLFVLITSLFCMRQAAQAQRIEAKVSTELQTLPLDRQQKLSSFADKVAHYINSYEWTNDPWNTTVSLDIQLILEDASSSAEERYKGRILISNTYDVQFFDQRWRFAYQSNDPIVHNENALNSFTSALDFYIYLVLGCEFDKWTTLGGTRYYETAKNIAEQSKFGLGRYIEGWDRRLELVNELLSDDQKPFREMVDYYFYGLSFIKQDNAKARQHCATAIKMLDKILAKDPDNDYAKKFISAHYIEMVEIFRRAQDKEPLRTLLVLDPDHSQAYREILGN
jgi:hypothetical protein